MTVYKKHPSSIDKIHEMISLLKYSQIFTEWLWDNHILSDWIIASDGCGIKIWERRAMSPEFLCGGMGLKLVY